MTITITITTETAAQASAEAAILAAGGLRQEHVQQAPAVTSPREATAYGPHLAFFGAERDALADALGVAPLDRTDPTSYVEAARELRADLGTNEGDSEALAAIARHIGLPVDAPSVKVWEAIKELRDEVTGCLSGSQTDEVAKALGLPTNATATDIVSAVHSLRLEAKRLGDVLGKPKAPPKRAPGRPRKAAEVAPTADDDDAPSINELADAIAPVADAAPPALTGTAIMRGADRPLTPEQDAKLDAALLAARGPDHPMAAAAPLTPAWPAPDTVDWWIARVKNTIRTDVEFGEWDRANVATAARVLFGVPSTPTTVKNALAFKFGLTEAQIATLLRSNDMWRNSVEIETDAVVVALLKMWRPEPQADAPVATPAAPTPDAQPLGFYVPPATASNVTAAFDDDPRGDGIPF